MFLLSLAGDKIAYPYLYFPGSSCYFDKKTYQTAEQINIVVFQTYQVGWLIMTIIGKIV